jgi:hypothetical protein
MSTTTGVSLEELKTKRSALKASGKSLSTSKEMGKIEDAIKVLQPNKYNSGQITQAKAKLASSTQPGTTASSTDLSALEQQLASKQDALVKATGNINDNPWYSEATRVGKLAKLNNIAQLEISNLNTQLAQKKQDIENAKPKTQVVTSTDDQGNMYTAVIDTATGQVINKSNLGQVGKATKVTGGSGGGTASDSAQMVEAINTIKQQTGAMGVSFEGGGSFITINQAKPLIEEWVSHGHTENDWWSRFGSNVFGGKPK